MFKFIILLCCCLIYGCSGMPQGFPAVREITHCSTGEIIPVDEASLDINGCLVGPCGERVCPLGNSGADGISQVNFRGNKGPKNTGSNGNAGPVDDQGRPVDPAAVTYLKQIENYKKWELQQIENAKKLVE